MESERLQRRLDRIRLRNAGDPGIKWRSRLRRMRLACRVCVRGLVAAAAEHTLKWRKPYISAGIVAASGIAIGFPQATLLAVGVACVVNILQTWSEGL